MNSVCWLKCGGCWCQEQKTERGKTDPLRKDQPIWRTHTQIEQNFNRFPSTLSTLPWEADGQAAWKILLNFIQFSDSSYWMFMPDIFDAWQSASSRWGCDQNLTSKHAEKLRSNCAIQCWLKIRIFYGSHYQNNLKAKKRDKNLPDKQQIKQSQHQRCLQQGGTRQSLDTHCLCVPIAELLHHRGLLSPVGCSSVPTVPQSIAPLDDISLMSSASTRAPGSQSSSEWSRACIAVEPTGVYYSNILLCPDLNVQHLGVFAPQPNEYKGREAKASADGSAPSEQSRVHPS